MLDIGGWELAVAALIALLVIGPRELPRVLRTVGQWANKARSVAREFQNSLDDMVRDSEIDEVKGEVESFARYDVNKDLGESVDPTGPSRGPAQVSSSHTTAGSVDEASEQTAGVAHAGKDEAAEPEAAEPQASKPQGSEPRSPAASEQSTEPATGDREPATPPASGRDDDEGGQPTKTRASG